MFEVNLNTDSSWKTELKSALRSKSQLEEFFQTKIDETNYKCFIPKSFAKKIKAAGPGSSLWKQFIPDFSENISDGLYDPIGDQENSPLPGLVHRYQNRVLFFPIATCPITCRYCFRKNELEETDSIFKKDFSKITQYINLHKEINEVIFSGGDPLILDDDRLFHYIYEFSKIPHLKYIRFHTRTPVILPKRVTSSFCKKISVLKKLFSEVTFVIHTNHLSELDYEACTAIKKLAKLPIKLLSQSVLLKDVNDSENDLLPLFTKLIELGVTPYYLHHPDKAKGTDHFDISIDKGKKLYSQLRMKLPGWGLPRYVIDSPLGKQSVL